MTPMVKAISRVPSATAVSPPPPFMRSTAWPASAPTSAPIGPPSAKPAAPPRILPQTLMSLLTSGRDEGKDRGAQNDVAAPLPSSYTTSRQPCSPGAGRRHGAGAPPAPPPREDER